MGGGGSSRVRSFLCSLRPFKGFLVRSIVVRSRTRRIPSYKLGSVRKNKIFSNGEARFRALGCASIVDSELQELGTPRYYGGALEFPEAQGSAPDSRDNPVFFFCRPVLG